MNKAFIFDLDGVLISSEQIWKREEITIFPLLFGKEIYNKLGPTVGVSFELTYQKARQLGATVTLEEVSKEFEKRAPKVYKTASLTPGLNDLKSELIRQNYRMGIVSASPRDWIEIVLERLHWDPAEFKILSLQEEPNLAHKPSPDGYLHVISELKATPATTFILEDTNAGIQSGKAAGATVIGFRQNLLEGYVQEGADLYADTIEDVIKIVLDKG